VAASFADAAEQQRRLPAELASQLKEAGLFTTCVPASLGGLEAPLAETLEAIETIARADAAAGWCVMIQGTSGAISGYVERDAAEEIWRGGDAVTGGAYAPSGKAESAPGGYRLSGRWSFVSGCTHCTWLLNSAVVEEGPPRTMLFPAAEATILDTWNVSGLVGTGSNDVEVTDLFVPQARTLSLIGASAVEDRPLYRFPLFGLLALGIGAVALGIARGAVDDLLELAGAKTPTLSRRKLAERPHVHHQVALAEAHLGSLRAFLYEAVGSAWQAAERGDELSLEARARLRLASTYATGGCAQVVDQAYNLGGGTSIYRSSLLQRRFRDIHAATQHMMVGQPIYELVGRVLLGLETDTSQL